jgi:predicted dehydrogenase
VEAFAYGGRLVLDYTDFEDSIISSFKFKSGAVAMLIAAGSSTMNLYRGEIICSRGSLFYDNHTGTVRYKKKGGDEETIPREDLPEGGGVGEEMSEFIRSIQENRKPTISGEDGRAAVAMALAARLSAKTGEPVPL